MNADNLKMAAVTVAISAVVATSTSLALRPEKQTAEVTADKIVARMMEIKASGTAARPPSPPLPPPPPETCKLAEGLYGSLAEIDKRKDGCVLMVAPECTGKNIGGRVEVRKSITPNERRVVPCGVSDDDAKMTGQWTPKH